MRGRDIALAVCCIAQALSGRGAAQSAFALCADTPPNRIVSTGPVRAVVATVDSLRVCLAVEGFSDSAAIHPRDWRSVDRLVILESRLGADARRMQESRVLTSWTKNETPLANDSSAVPWRTAVIDMVAAKWDVAARQMERRDLEQGISQLLTQKAWILGQIDTLKRRDDSLRVETSESLSRARMDKSRSVSDAQRAESAARSRLSRAQQSLASATSSGDAARTQLAREAVSAAESALRTATDRLRAAQAVDPTSALRESEDLRDRLDASGRISTLKSMLMELDADNRVAAMRADLQAIDAQPDPEVRLAEAAARLRALLAR